MFALALSIGLGVCGDLGSICAKGYPVAQATITLNINIEPTQLVSIDTTQIDEGVYRVAVAALTTGADYVTDSAKFLVFDDRPVRDEPLMYFAMVDGQLQHEESYLVTVIDLAQDVALAMALGEVE